MKAALTLLALLLATVAYSTVLTVGGGAARGVAAAPGSGGGGGGSDYDEIALPTALDMSTDGLIYALDLDSTTDADALTDLMIHIRYTGETNQAVHNGGGEYEGSANEGIVHYLDDGNWDGNGAVRIRPPLVGTVEGTNSGYVAFLYGFNPNSGSTPNRINFGYTVNYGTQYWAGCLPSICSKNMNFESSVGSSTRYMFFTTQSGELAAAFSGESSTIFALAPTLDGTIGHYQASDQGSNGGYAYGNSQDAMYVSATSDHDGSSHNGVPVLATGEWYYFEHEIWFSTNPYHQVYVWDRNGDLVANDRLYIDGDSLSYVNPGAGSFDGMEGFGYYFNGQGTRLTNDGATFGSMRISKNRTAGDYMGPPTGFLL